MNIKNLFKDQKTNWKYVAVVAVFALSFGVEVFAQETLQGSVLTNKDPVQMIIGFLELFINLFKAFLPIILIGLVISIPLIFMAKGFKKSSVKNLSMLFKFFSILFFIIAFISLISVISSPNLSIILFFLLYLIGGIVCFFLSRGLYKEKRWTWFGSLIFLVGALLSYLISQSLIGSLFFIFVIFLFIKNKRVFLEKPKQPISQLIQDRRFLITAVGLFLMFLIMGGNLAYQFWQMSKNEIKAPIDVKKKETKKTKIPEKTIKEETNELIKSLKNNKYFIFDLGKKIELKNGRYKTLSGKTSIQILKTAAGDLNYDGKKDAVVVLSIYHIEVGTPEIELAIMINKNGKYNYFTGLAGYGRDLGYGIRVNSINIQSGEIIVNIDDTKRNIKKKINKYKLSGNQLKKVDETINWKSYFNPEADFIFRYPKDWEIKKEFQYKNADCQKNPECEGLHYVFLNKINDSRLPKFAEKEKFGIVINMSQCAGIKRDDLFGGNWICVFDENPETLNIFSKIKNSFTTIIKTNENKTGIGIIEGSLGYPSDSIPSKMKVCAENIKTKEKYCTDKHIKNNKYKYGEGYKIEAPVGNYYVFAFLPDSDYKAYYSELTVCGTKFSCPSNDPILITVINGYITTNIDPAD